MQQAWWDADLRAQPMAEPAKPQRPLVGGDMGLARDKTWNSPEVCTKDGRTWGWDTGLLKW